jgi:class 3 adenylate cyclase
MTVATQMAIGIEKSNARLALSTALFRTEELSGSYSRFVPFETLKQAGYNTVFDVKIGDGVEKQRTILFSDIRDFTQLCETMSPSDVLKFLNSYFGSLSPIIKKHNGIVDKFIGDCVMAIFIDPLDAMNAAIEMQRHLIHYNLERRTNGRKPVYAGIGICQGSVLMGPVGFDGKIEITVVSDVVNTASRLDGLSKELEAKILVTGIAPEILERLDEDVLSVEHGQKSVKGKTQFVEVTELLDQKLLDLFDSIERTEEVARFQEEYISLFVKKINLAKKRTRNQALQ